MPFAYSNGLDIYYEIHGEGEPLILVPGLGSVSGSWQQQVDFFKKYFQVITFDNRGCGKSSVPEGSYTISDIAEDIAGLMDFLHIDKAYLVGRSMGGKVLQEMAIKYPQKVKKMVLSNTTARPNDLTKMVFQTWSIMADEGVAPEILKRNIVSWVHRKETIARLTKSFYQSPMEASMRTFAVHCRACISHNLVEKLPLIKAPTLVITGEKDILTPVEDALLLVDNIASANLAIMDKVAHAAYMESPDQYNSLITEFLGTA